jgi:hypothetical protein
VWLPPFFLYIFGRVPFVYRAGCLLNNLISRPGETGLVNRRYLRPFIDCSPYRHGPPNRVFTYPSKLRGDGVGSATSVFFFPWRIYYWVAFCCGTFWCQTSSLTPSSARSPSLYSPLRLLAQRVM